MKAVLQKGKHCSVVQQRFVASQHRHNTLDQSEVLCAKSLLAGFAGGVAAASIGDPLTAFGIIIPFMELSAVAGFFWLRHLERQA